VSDRQPVDDMTVRELAERLASREPVPGGGSAAAVVGALAAALVHMVTELTLGRDEHAAAADEVREIALAAATAQSELLNLAVLDANAFDAVLRARRLPRDTDEDRDNRRAQVGAATREATRAPMRTAELAASVLEYAHRMAPIGNRNAVSDAGVAALLAAASARAAILNVRINLPLLPADEPLRTEAADAVERVRARLEALEGPALSAVDERIGVAPSA
jgi:formiminotetrahydrofolate cyclodeaminase